MEMQVRSEFQVFSFTGVVDGQDAFSVKAGYARAQTHEQVIDAMASYGFSVQAISGLDEIQETLEILELIALRSSEVPETDFINLLPGRDRHFVGEEVYAISGVYADQQGGPVSGFAVAGTEKELYASLAALGLRITSHLSLAQARSKVAEMVALNCGDEDLIDLESELAH